jgi:arylsulfatase
MTERTAPKLGKFSNTVTLEVDVPAKAEGVLYALGAFSGGLTCYVQNGVLCYEYNLFEIQRTQIKAKERLPVGKAAIEVESKRVSSGRNSPMDVSLKVNGQVVAQGRVPVIASLSFTSNECLDIGSDLGSPVSRDYYDRAPFPFNGVISTTSIACPAGSPAGDR